MENKQMFDITLKIGTAMMLAGPSSCGKSSFVKNLIMSRDILFNKPSLNVYIVCSNVQNIYEDMVKNKNVKKIFYTVVAKMYLTKALLWSKMAFFTRAWLKVNVLSLP